MRPMALESLKNLLNSMIEEEEPDEEELTELVMKLTSQQEMKLIQIGLDGIIRAIESSQRNKRKTVNFR